MMRPQDRWLLSVAALAAVLGLLIAFLVVGCADPMAPQGPALVAAKGGKPGGGGATPRGNAEIVRYRLMPKQVRLEFPQDSTGKLIVPATPVATFCLFFEFSDGKIGKRRGDALCGDTYAATVPDSLRSLNRWQTAVMDTLSAASFQFRIEPVEPPAPLRAAPLRS